MDYLCQCGCREQVKVHNGKPNKFIIGHTTKNKIPWNKGRKRTFSHTEEAKRKIGVAARGNQNMKGKKQTEEAKEKIRLAGIGKTHTEETKLKLSEAKKGRLNPNWKGGMQKVNGYVYELCPDHPNANSGGCVAKHRVIMEDYLGRYLESDEIPHHCNEIKNDNRIENLELILWADHTRHHHLGMKHSPESRQKIKESWVRRRLKKGN